MIDNALSCGTASFSLCVMPAVVLPDMLGSPPSPLRIASVLHLISCTNIRLIFCPPFPFPRNRHAQLGMLSGDASLPLQAAGQLVLQQIIAEYVHARACRSLDFMAKAVCKRLFAPFCLWCL